MFTLSPFSTNESALLREIKTFRLAEPALPTEQFVARANSLLSSMGIEYYLQIDRATCDKLLAERAKDLKKKVNLLATLQSVGGEKTKLSLPEPLFELTGCPGCFLRFAMLELTSDTFVTKVQDHNIKFALPSGVVSTQVWLVDPANEANILSLWRIPGRLMPIGVSHDQNVLYLGFDDPVLKDLALSVFTEGTFEFTSRAEAETGGIGVQLVRSERDKTTGRARIEFNRWKKRLVVSYPATCGT